jgi:hypothetical protein
MGNNDQRTVSTFLIWGAFTLMMIFGNMDNFLIVGIVAVAAAASTAAVWESAGKDKSGHETSEKAKRNARERLSRLLEQMDDEEMVELDVLLSQRGTSIGYDERRGA